MWDPFAEFEKAVLANGLTVYAAHWPNRPWESMGFLIHSGAEQDPVGLEGTAHFVEHLVSKNAPVSTKELKEFFKVRGGRVGLGETSFQGTSYECFLPTDNTSLTEGLTLLGSMLLTGILEKAIEREREVIVGEFYRTFPMTFTYDLARRERDALYQNTFHSRFLRPLGEPESIGRITQTDLQGFYDKHYTPANMTVVGVGGATLDRLVSLLEKSPFGSPKHGKRTPLPVRIEHAHTPVETKYVVEHSKIFPNTPLSVGQYRSIAMLPGNLTLGLPSLCEEMLDGLLLEELRELRGWTYDIHSHRLDFGHFSEFEVVCRDLKLNAIDDVEEVVDQIIASATKREDLFEQTRNRKIARLRMKDLTAADIVSEAMGDLKFEQRIITYAEMSRNYETFNFSDVQAVFQALRPEQRWTLIFRP